MREMLREPVLTATILGLWLVLNGTVAPGHVLLGLALGLAVPPLTRRLRPEPPRVGRPLRALRLAAVVLGDIVLANLEVARRILGPEARLTPRFFRVPLDIQAPHGIATLAAIITLTPGTVSADVSPDRRFLLVHGLNVEDVERTIAQIKHRYETPLREILA
jgi:multicomponent K+:H+ antiporter subunit E